jgi:hypothetical protein
VHKDTWKICGLLLLLLLLLLPPLTSLARFWRARHGVAYLLRLDAGRSKNYIVLVTVDTAAHHLEQTKHKK